MRIVYVGAWHVDWGFCSVGGSFGICHCLKQRLTRCYVCLLHSYEKHVAYHVIDFVCLWFMNYISCGRWHFKYGVCHVANNVERIIVDEMNVSLCRQSKKKNSVSFVSVCDVGQLKGIENIILSRIQAKLEIELDNWCATIVVSWSSASSKWSCYKTNDRTTSQILATVCRDYVCTL